MERIDNDGLVESSGGVDHRHLRGLKRGGETLNIMQSDPEQA